MISPIIYPALYINTIDFNRGICAFLEADKISARYASDIAADMVHEISIILGGQNKPSTIIIAIGDNGSFTGARIGWCIARALAMVYKCDIWSVKKEVELVNVCGMIESYNDNGPRY